MHILKTQPYGYVYTNIVVNQKMGFMQFGFSFNGHVMASI